MKVTESDTGGDADADVGGASRQRRRSSSTPEFDRIASEECLPSFAHPWENLGGRKEGNHRCTWVDADQRSISSSPFHVGGNARNSSFVTHPWENLGGLRGVYPGMLPQRMRKLPEGGKRSLRFVRVTCGHLTEKEMQ